MLLGTGTSCIYPLLGCRLNDWHFKATDVSKVAVKCAEKNVEVNDLQDRIEGTYIHSCLYIFVLLFIHYQSSTFIEVLL